MRCEAKTLAVIVVLACKGTSGQASPQECAPPTDDIAANSGLAVQAGEYRLRLVASAGAKTGSAVEGSLKLQPQSEALRYRVRPGGSRDTTVTHPLYGSAELDLAAVDAVSVGSLTSTDPMQPGVLVIQHPRSTSQTPATAITIRLGSDANRRDRQRVDGGYTALRVREATPERLAGTWSSGVKSERSAGYFCAVRKDG